MSYITMDDWLTLDKYWANLIAQSGEKMNLSLLQRPKRVMPGTKTMYVYAPAVVSASVDIEPGTVIKILEVFRKDKWCDTVLKVMSVRHWDEHNAYWKASEEEPKCTRYEKAQHDDPLCACELELELMPDYIKANVHYVLIADIGK